MVCNGSPAKQIGRCVISPRDEWMHLGCMPDYTSSFTGCRSAKVAVVDGVKDVQMEIDCSMRHADRALAYPEWRSDGGGNPRCATLESDEFLELKYYDGARELAWTKRLAMLDNGNLQVFLGARRRSSCCCWLFSPWLLLEASPPAPPLYL